MLMLTGKGGLAVCLPEPDWQYVALAGRLYHQTDRKRVCQEGWCDARDGASGAHIRYPVPPGLIRVGEGRIGRRVGRSVSGRAARRTAPRESAPSKVPRLNRA